MTADRNSKSTTASTSSALLGARQALTDAPEAAQFKWRATCEWVSGTHSQSTVQRLLRPRQRAVAPDRVHLRRRPSGDLRLRGQRRDAGGIRARRPRLLPDRGHRRRRAEPQDPAALGQGDGRGRHGPAGHPRHRQRRAQRLRRHQGHLRHRRRRARRKRSRRSSPSRRSARRCSTSSPTRPTSRSRCAERPHAGTDRRRRHRRRPCRPGDEPLPRRQRSIDHVVLERGEVANSWRTERWDSLRLLTPNWQSRLPGHAYDGRRSRRLHDDARGHRASSTTTRRVVERTGAHLHDGDVGERRRTAAIRSSPIDGVWRGRAVVLASGALQRAGSYRPSARRCPPSIRSSRRASTAIRSSSTGSAACSSSAHRPRGVQLADEIQRSGPPRDARGRRARPHAAHLSRPRHPMVARCGRRAR